MFYPEKVLHWLDNEEAPPEGGEFFDKYNPGTGAVLIKVARGRKADAERAVASAAKAFASWSVTPVIQRAELLRAATQPIQARKHEIAEIVALETGKSSKDALREAEGAVELGYFMAGEGRRFYGRTTTSAVPNRFAMTVRQPVGVCALIIAANTPFPNVAWKAFPALLCGNAAVMKTSEDVPYTAVWFAKILQEAGVPPGVFSVLQGLGEEAGAALVEDPRVDLVSFTGSVAVARWIHKTAGERLAKVCIESGGKNPLVVCDDADLEAAAQAAALSAFSNAGQRCASGTRVIVFETVYDKFRKLLVEKTKALRVGSDDADDFGPVINEAQLKNMLAAVENALKAGATLLTGGKRLRGGKYQNGYYLEPTILENVPLSDPITCEEQFGPVTALYRVKDFEEALAFANDSSFGLTAAIHTRSIHRAEAFRERCHAGVISINGPTYGSEPHLPFGGLKNSGTGWREPGTEALDIYSEWKTVYVKHDPTKV